MNFSFYTLLIALPFVAFLALRSYWLNKEIETLKKNNTELILTNNSLTEAINVLQNDFSRGLEAIEKMSEKTQKEVHYVTKIKTQIIKDKNASCIDTTNAIYNRLWEQADSNSSATSGKIGN